MHSLYPDSFRELANAKVSAEIVLLTIIDGEIHVVLLERQAPPLKGYYVLPGALLEVPRDIEGSATEILFDQVGTIDARLEQFHTFTAPERDSRGWVVSVAFIGAVRDSWVIDNVDGRLDSYAIRVEMDGDRIALTDLGGIAVPIGFDHLAIIERAILHLRKALNWTMHAFKLVPAEHFTLLELQQVHEIILGCKLNKEAFRKSMLQRYLPNGGKLEPTGKVQPGAHRPAMLFQISGGDPRY